ncbi:MAG: fasciclin domain-containing protein [Gemmatimonadota bacterium]
MLRTLTLAAAAALVAVPSAAHAQMPQKDIVTVAVEAGSFETLAAALDAAGLVETLRGEGPFTVFAPTDEAFAKLPEGTVEALLKDKDALTRILTYHVVAGRVTSDQVVHLSQAETVAGIEAPIQVKDGQVYVAGAKVVKTDIQASNGVIHVIDTVMLPPEM